VIALYEALELFVQEVEPPKQAGADAAGLKRDPVIVPVLPGDITARYAR